MKKPAAAALPQSNFNPYQNCSTCRFCQDGQCRRSPPTVVQIAIVRYSDRDIAPAIWPQVEPGDWCGEWQGAPKP